AAVWCIALYPRHRINPESAARLEAGMTMEQVVQMLGAEPGNHSSAGNAEQVTWLAERGGYVWWSDFSWAESKSILDAPLNGGRRFRLWMSDDYLVLAEFREVSCPGRACGISMSPLLGRWSREFGVFFAFERGALP